ncbi:nucleotidyltransferase family protein [candidate division KSB1 bacterium]|nr:nucleotidyltransferase family protein [candidate division KSB1 bacterium]
MKAFLLAAGVGSRLGALTEHTPKCLLPIGGRPLLDFWFEAFAAAGVTDVLINLHHLPDRVHQYLDRQPYPVRVRREFEPVLLGSAGTIRGHRDFVANDQSFLIVYADNFARVDLRRLMTFHREHRNPVLSLLAYETDEPTRCGILEFDSAERVVSFEEKPARPRTTFANAGIHVAAAELFDYLPAELPADLGFHVLPRLVGKMFGYVTNEYIQDIGTPLTYEKVQRDLAAQSN